MGTYSLAGMNGHSAGLMLDINTLGLCEERSWVGYRPKQNSHMCVLTPGKWSGHVFTELLLYRLDLGIQGLRTDSEAYTIHSFISSKTAA